MKSRNCRALAFNFIVMQMWYFIREKGYSKVRAFEWKLLMNNYIIVALFYILPVVMRTVSRIGDRIGGIRGHKPRVLDQYILRDHWERRCLFCGKGGKILSCFWEHVHLHFQWHLVHEWYAPDESYWAVPSCDTVGCCFFLFSNVLLRKNVTFVRWHPESEVQLQIRIPFEILRYQEDLL